MYNLKGTIKVIGEVQQVSDSFKKRDLVIVDESGKYAQTILLQMVQDRCELLDSFKVGEIVDVAFFINGKEWTNPKTGEVRFFNTLDAFKISYTGEHAQSLEHAAEMVKGKFDTDDDLPF